MLEQNINHRLRINVSKNWLPGCSIDQSQSIKFSKFLLQNSPYKIIVWKRYTSNCKSSHSEHLGFFYISICCALLLRSLQTDPNYCYLKPTLLQYIPRQWQLRRNCVFLRSDVLLSARLALSFMEFIILLKSECSWINYQTMFLFSATYLTTNTSHVYQGHGTYP